MKVVNLKSKKTRQKSSYKTMYVSLLGLFAFGFLLYGASNLPEDSDFKSPQLYVNVRSDDFEPSKSSPLESNKELKNFEIESFNRLYESAVMPNTEPISDNSKPSITSDAMLDNLIWQVASQKGYKLTAKPLSELQPYTEELTDRVHLVQPTAYGELTDIINRSREDDVPLMVTSAYQSVEAQKVVFTQRLTQNLGSDYNQLSEQNRTEIIYQILRNTAPPGYSRHHTGYTVDFGCNDGSVDFVASSCFEWLTSNNFYNVKVSNFIPSYPFGVNNIGPDPIPWKFVWINSDLLYN
jgi:LAS superfamily LD-carboxypeptidase LdcB